MIKSVLMPEELLRQEAATLEAMGAIYCKAHHAGEPRVKGRKLCEECASVVDYAVQRTKYCPNKRKGNCEDCSIHCYKPQMREAIRRFMRYAGPRMLLRHPIMAYRHLRKKLAGRKG